MGVCSFGDFRLMWSCTRPTKMAREALQLQWRPHSVLILRTVRSISQANRQRRTDSLQMRRALSYMYWTVQCSTALNLVICWAPLRIVQSTATVHWRGWAPHSQTRTSVRVGAQEAETVFPDVPCPLPRMLAGTVSVTVVVLLGPGMQAVPS